MAHTRLLIVAVAVAVVVVIGLMRPPGSARSDEVADVVTNAISYPPKGSAAGLARAAQNTGSVIVYAAEDLAPDAPGRAGARLGFRVDYLVRRSVFDFDPWNPDLEQRRACYEAEFGYQYVADLRRVWCPEDTVPIRIPPPTPTPTAEIPDGADTVMVDVLEQMPEHPTRDSVRAEILRRMPSPGTDLGTGLRNLPPDVRVNVNGQDIAVALWDRDDRRCLLGSRIDGDTLVWRPTRIQMAPGELSCEPTTALHRQGTRPPH